MLEMGAHPGRVMRTHARIHSLVLATALVALACGGDVAGTDAIDEGARDSGIDLPDDAAPRDAPDAADAPPDDDAPIDAGADLTPDAGPDATDACDPSDTGCAYRQNLARLVAEGAGREMECDPWGGWVNHPESLGDPEPGDFFRVEKLDGAWWFVTPAGNPMISKGVTDVNWLGATLRDDAFHQILVDKYGNEENWNAAARARMREWHFNTVGPWSSAGIAGQFAHATVILDSAGHAPRHRPGDLVADYFDAPFAAHCEQVAIERATPHVDDPGLVGYFLDNELAWGPDWRGDLTLLQHYVAFPAGAPGRAEALRVVRERAADIDDFNATWGTSIADWADLEGLTSADFAARTAQADEVATEFAVHAFRQYATHAIAGLRKVDPNHMVLGCRFAAYPGDALVRAAAEVFDVISLAGYHANWVSELDAIYPQIDKPFLIEEFSFKATDSGLMNVLFYAQVVDKQQDRALAYHRYVEELIRRPYAVAYHWYKWMDNPPLEDNLLAGDNFGLLDFADAPYEDFVEYARHVNFLAETWHAEGDGRFNPDRDAFPFCDTDEDAIDALYAGMTVRQRIGQHLMTRITRAGSRVDAGSLARIEAGLLGGVFVSQITGVATGDPVMTARFLRHAQRTAITHTGVPLFVSSDQEGGVYTSVNAMTGGTDSIGPTAVGSTGDDTVAFRQFDLMGREVAAMGINMNFGPLLDTHYAIDNGNLNTRTFGPDTDLNARLGLAAVHGFQRNLVLPTVKHFPGDGMTAGNTHHEFVVNDAPMEDLEAAVLRPFRTVLARGCDGVMIMPAQFAAIDDRRAAITSDRVMRDLLRGKLGFDGLIVTDDLDMYGALLGLGEGEEPGYEALRNGADLLLYVEADAERLSGLIDRIQAGLDLPEGDPDRMDSESFEASTKRLLRFKQKYCLFDQDFQDATAAAAVAGRTGRPEDHGMSLDHALRAVAVVANDGTLPLSGRRVLCVGPEALLADPASGWSWLLGGTFCGALQAADPSVIAMNYLVDGTEQEAGDWVLENASMADVVVAATFQAYFSPAQQELMDRLIDDSGLPVVHVAQGVPFDLILTAARASASVALMGSLPVMFEAGATVLYGDAAGGGLVRWDLDHQEARFVEKRGALRQAP